MFNQETTPYLLVGGAAPLPPIGGGTEPLAAERACKHQGIGKSLDVISEQHRLELKFFQFCLSRKVQYSLSCNIRNYEKS